MLTLFDLQWLKLTFKQRNFTFFESAEQFAIRNSTISLQRAILNFDLSMRIFKTSGGRTKKKSTQALFL
jgi:hypothetical protein